MADLAIPYAVTEPSILTVMRVWRSLTTLQYFFQANPDSGIRNLGIGPCTVDILCTTKRYIGSVYPLLVLSRTRNWFHSKNRNLRKNNFKRPEILDLRDLFPRVLIFSLYAAVGASSPMVVQRQSVGGPIGRVCPNDSHEWRRRDTMSLVPHLFFLPSEWFLHYLQQSRRFMIGR